MNRKNWTVFNFPASQRPLIAALVRYYQLTDEDTPLAEEQRQRIIDKFSGKMGVNPPLDDLEVHIVRMALETAHTDLWERLRD